MWDTMKVDMPRAPLTYFNDGWGGPKDSFWSDILAKRDFLGSMKDAGIHLGSRKQHRDFFGSRKQHRDFFRQLKSTILSAIYCLCGITGYF